MLRPITPTAHGAIDYATVAGTALAPSLLKFPARAAGAAYGVASAILSLAAFTNFRPAVKRAVPLKAHGATDAAMGLVLPAVPWMLGFARNKSARNFFLGLTAMMAVTTALTNWSAAEPRRRKATRRRR